MVEENKIIIAGYGGGKGGEVRIPKEVPEGVNSLTGATHQKSGFKLDLTTTEIDVLDLICEGPIHGLVTGKYIYSGILGNVGWESATFQPNTAAIDSNEIRWLQSVFWNETPVVGEDGKYNFQQVNVRYTKGHPNGSNISDSIIDELSISRNIQERLRGGGEEFAKIYRILNKDCVAVDINIKITQLAKTSSNKKTLGDIQQASIDYQIYYRPVFNNKQGGNFILAKTENITGKITAGYIRASRITFNRDYSSDIGFLGWEIKIVRTTEDSTSSTLRNQSFVDSITEVYGNKYIYPNSAIVSATFDAEFFSQIPERTFLVDLIKVRIPSNYDPILKKYDESEPWDGTFKQDQNGNYIREWTDNPVWCYYDLLTNKRYGLGLYIDENLIDKITLYEIAKYCDTLVLDGFGGLEPRFTCNVYINSSDEAYKLINSMASIFRAITYYSAGNIYTSQDSEKTPIYQFTNANVVDGDFNYSSSARKARHTVAVVRFNDKNNFYKPTIEYVEHVEGIRKYGLRDVEVPAFGCTSRGQAIRLGRWALLTESLESESIQFRASLEASFLRPGDIFQVFDVNRKTQRLGGRLYNIIASPSSTTVTLDYKITGLNDSTTYKFSLLTPSFYYDSSLVTGLTSDNVNDIRKNQIQNLSFSGNQLSLSGNKSIINFNQTLDYTNYNVSGNLIWMIEASGNNILGEIPDNQFDTYRVLNIRETDSHIYEIEGLQYDINKFNQIESGFSFVDTVIQTDYTIPPGPTGLILYTEDIGDNSKYIHYKFTPPSNLSNISNFRVFLKTSPFSVGDENGVTYLLEDLSNDIYSGRYFPTEDNTFYFRVYSVSYQGILSTTYAENNITVGNINPLHDIEISSLQLLTGDLFENLAGTTSSGIYSTDSPEFGWQVGINGINFDSQITYRITAREPSQTNIPSSNIYYELSGYNTDQSSFVFDFEDNISTISRLGIQGPFREYDLVVEAMNTGGYSSAGGNFITSVYRDSDYNNARGYDIVYVNNPPPRSITLYTGDTSTDFYSTGYATQQWITQDGEIKIYFSKSGQATTITDFFGDDIAGAVLYYSNLPFLPEEAKQQVPLNPPQKIINSTTVTTDTNPISVALGLFDTPNQYIALAPFDSFDIAIAERIDNYLLTGLNVSNVVELTNPSLAGSYKAWVEIELDNKLNGNSFSRTLNSSWVSKSFNIANVQQSIVLENERQVSRGVITFSSPMPHSGYAIVMTQTAFPPVYATVRYGSDEFSKYETVKVENPDTSIGITSYNITSINLEPFAGNFDIKVPPKVGGRGGNEEGDIQSVTPNTFKRKIFIGVIYR